MSAVKNSGFPVKKLSDFMKVHFVAKYIFLQGACHISGGNHIPSHAHPLCVKNNNTCYYKPSKSGMDLKRPNCGEKGLCSGGLTDQNGTLNNIPLKRGTILFREMCNCEAIVMEIFPFCLEIS